MTKLYDSQIIQILPEYLAGRVEVQALSFAINRAIKRLIDYCGNTSVFAVIDTLPECVLDMLAIELDTQYYDTSNDIDTKRKLIKNTLVWFISAGTPSAVEELVASVFGEGAVKEWFEYGDDPYFFKVITNATMTADIDEQFFSMLKKVKNTRSHIRGIEVHRKINQEKYIGSAVIASREDKIHNTVQSSNQNRFMQTIWCGLLTYPQITIRN